MSFVVTPDQMRAAEQRAIDAGTSESALMLRASEAIAGWIDDQFHSHDSNRYALGLVGPGKNGGDTLVVLSLLAGLGWSVSACPVGRDVTGDLPADPAALAQINMTDEITEPEGSGAFVILDGIYGAGGRAELPEVASNHIAAINELRETRELAVIAIDLPSGVDALTGEAAPTALPADATLSIGGLKAGLLREPAATLAGEVVHIDIGISFDDSSCIAPQLQASQAATNLPPRMATAGKHDYGGTLVIGGAPNYFGAPRLAAEAALLAGAGIVGAAVPRMLVSTIAVQVPEVVFVPLSDNDARKSAADITKALTGEHGRYTAAVLGPGLGQDEAASALLEHLFGQATTRSTSPIGFGISRPATEESGDPKHSALASVPLVLDADALNWLAKQENRWSFLENVNAVLTPHTGELARLRACMVEEINADRIEAARSTARESGQVVVLKGGYAIVAAPDGRMRVAQRATPELATPGTGDVLAGIIGGFLAQGFEPFDAACVAVFVGGEAGRKARYAVSSRSVLARDLLANIGAALDDLDGTIW